MDLVLDVARVPGPGETLAGRAMAFIPGGKGANQAVACARLGGQVAMIGCVGKDEFGERLSQELSRDGVVLDYLYREDAASTGVALIMVDETAQNRIVIVPGTNGLMSPEHVDRAAEMIDRAAIVLLQLEIPLSTVERAVQRAANAGARIALNPAPVQDLSGELLARADYLVPNESEAALLTGIEVVDLASAGAAARALVKRGARRVLLTLGAQGVLIAEEDGLRHYMPPQVTAVDTTAAGDTFIGALAVGLVEGMNLDAAAKFALKAASLSVTRKGAQTSIPYRADVSAFA
jgi:ribokinase